MNALNRASRIEQMRKKILQGGRPRLLMTGILMLTGLTGFLSSFTLLHLGMTSMALRYPLAILLGYGVFLLCIRAWVRSHATIPQETKSTSSSNWSFDLPNLKGGSNGGSGDFSFKGGSFGGGGSGASFQSGSTGLITSNPAALPVLPPENMSNAPNVANTSSGGGGWSLDLDEGAIFLIVLVVALGLFIALGYVIWAAPAILAEILVDAVAASSLYGGLKQISRTQWFLTALKKTGWVVGVLCILFGGAGFLIQEEMPKVRSLGDVFQMEHTKTP